MPKASGLDTLPNMYTHHLVCPANDGLIEQMSSRYSKADKIGLLIQRIEYHVNASGLRTAIAAAGDQMAWGITQYWNGGVAPGLTPLAQGTPIIDTGNVTLGDIQGHLCPPLGFPVITEFPVGREVLVHPAALYFYVRGNAMAATCDVYLKMFYVERVLADADYNELLQNILLQDTL